MQNFLPRLAIWTAKITSLLIRLSGMGMASSLPGKIALYICPAVLPYLSNQLSNACLAVTGTNGKSTTSGLLASILTEAGYKVIHNRQGANLVAGITATFIENANLDGSLRGNFALLEVDEAALPVLTKFISFKEILVTNLFRDQLDRFGELDKTAQLIGQGIKDKQSVTILNADDPNVCNLPCPKDAFFYGVDFNATDANSDAAEILGTPTNVEISYCPRCGSEISYSTNAKQGSTWSCLQCNYHRPDLNFRASEIKLLSAGSNFKISNSYACEQINLSLPGLFNIYNASAAGAAANYLGVELPTIKLGLEKYQTLFGRSEKININERTVIIQLIKNPAGTSKSISALVDSECAKVLIAINDNLADGRDISWLWDADFENLANIRASFILSGSRAHDMAVRLKYAGINWQNCICIPSLSAAFSKALEDTPSGNTLWIMPTYTALLEMQSVLRNYKV